MKDCPSAPVKEILFHEIIRIIKIEHPGMEWPVTMRMPCKQYMLDCLAVLDYHHQFLSKNPKARPQFRLLSYHHQYLDEIVDDEVKVYPP